MQHSLRLLLKFYIGRLKVIFCVFHYHTFTDIWSYVWFILHIFLLYITTTCSTFILYSCCYSHGISHSMFALTFLLESDISKK
jgi:hypothetical protein